MQRVDPACIDTYPGIQITGKWLRNKDAWNEDQCDDSTCKIRCKQDGKSFNSNYGEEFGDGDIVECYDDFKGSLKNEGKCRFQNIHHQKLRNVYNNTALLITNDVYNILLGCYTNDVDSTGNDIYSLSGVSSVGACQELCNRNDNCKYFMYGSAVSLGTCWLKYERTTTLTPYNGLIFGPKMCGTRII